MPDPILTDYQKYDCDEDAVLERFTADFNGYDSNFSSNTIELRTSKDKTIIQDSKWIYINLGESNTEELIKKIQDLKFEETFIDDASITKDSWDESLTFKVVGWRLVNKDDKKLITILRKQVSKIEENNRLINLNKIKKAREEYETLKKMYGVID